MRYVASRRMSGDSGLKTQGVVLTETTHSALSKDDKVVLVAEVIAERCELMTISNIGSHEEHTSFVAGALDWDSARLRIILEDLDDESKLQCVDEALHRTRRAIAKYSSLAPRPSDYFWFMVNQIHGKEGAARLKTLSNSLRKKAKIEQKMKVAA